MKNKKIDTFKIKFALVIILTIFISGTITYGFFNPYRNQTGTNDLTTDCFNVSFTENSDSISLANAYPVDDSVGLNNVPYSFTITNTCDTEATYHVLLSSKSGSFDNRFVKTSVNGETPKILSTYTRNVNYKFDEGYDNSYILKTGSLSKDESASVAVRLWIDSATTYEDIARSSWEGQVRVVSTVTAIEKEHVYLKDELLDKANDASIDNYENGNKKEMYTFNHEATEQTPIQTDYRFIGSTPNNYISFNDEIWRIIGVFPVKSSSSGEFENRLKIMRNDKIGILAWNSSGENEWVGGDANVTLNGDYYNRTGDYADSGLNETARSQVAKTPWYLGGYTDVITGENFYKEERSLNTCVTANTCSGSTRNTSVEQNVGHIYPSDYLYTYSLGISDWCYEKGCASGDDDPANFGWIRKDTINASADQWTMMPVTTNSYHIIHINTNDSFVEISGFVDDNGSASLKKGIIPVVYLNADIELIAGDGSAENPYQIK